MFASDSKIIGWNTGFAYLLLAISASVLAGVAGAAPDPEPDYRAIRAAYVERDGARYKAAVGAAINHLRRLAPDLCAQQQRRLLETAVAATFDGLETLWLLLQDCVAQAKDPAVRNQALANAQIFVERARFAGPPAPNVAMYAARHDGLVVRGTRGEAVRAMVEQARRSAPSDLAGQPLDRLLGRADVRRALCGLDIRRDQHNRAALPDLIVRALCEDGGASGGFGAVDAMCRRLSLDMSAAPTPRLVVPPSGSLADRLQQTPGVGAGDIERLRDFCDDRIAGSGFAGGGLDALDGHGASACLGGRAEEVAEVGRIAQLIDDCLSSGKDDNPIADDGGTGGEPTDKDPDTVENPDGSKTVTTRNPDGSTTETIIYPDGTTFSTTKHNDRTTTAELTRPDGSSERVTIDDAGKKRQVVKVAPDGATTTKEYGPDGELVRTEEIHRLGDVDDVVVTENGRTYITIVPAGWLEEALDRIKKQQDNDQGKGPHIIEIWATPPDSKLPGSDSPGGFDLSNPACLELLTPGYISAGGILTNEDLWNYVFGRKPGEPHPSTVYPTPDTVDRVNPDQLCGDVGDGSLAGGHCPLPVLCVEGTELDQNCQCKPVGGGGARGLAGTVCLAYRCPGNGTPVPVGLHGCECRDPETEGGTGGTVSPPGPQPDPFADAVARTDALLAKPGIATGGPLFNGESTERAIFADPRPLP